MEPSDFSRRILLCVTGLSPQIITETLYALAIEQKSPFVPGEIHLITTQQGATSARLTLLDSDQGYFHRLCADYGLDSTSIRFDTDTIHVIRDPGGVPLDDIRTRDDNEAAADTITALVRQLTYDSDSAVHASIAGGRKTMGFYLGYALSLFGRPQDRLSHVLVPPPFESHTEFFYPPPRPKVLFTRENPPRPVRTDEARITLAPIPFVRMRDGLTEVMRKGGASFSAAVAQAQKSLEPAELVMNLATREVNCGGIALTLAPVDFAFYAWFARRAKNGQPGICRNTISTRETDQFLAEYPKMDDLSGGYERVVHAVGATMEVGYFDQRRSRVNTTLRRALGELAATSYLIQSYGKRPRSRYGLVLKPGQIRFVAMEENV